MKTKNHLNEMVRTALSEFKQKIEGFCKNIEDGQLTPEVAGEVSKYLGEAAMSAAREGYRDFLESYDLDMPTLKINEVLYRRKMLSSKTIMTAFGRMKIERHLYQPDLGGKTFAPLDAMWGMEDEYATPEVREASLFTVSHVTPKETEAILKKCAPFHPSATAIQTMARRVGRFIEENEESLSKAVGEKEKAPEGTRSLVASLDGVNVLLNEPGTRQGRPKERPDSSADKKCPTSYRNAMVGSVSFYGEVPPDGHTPDRLNSHYVSHMPEKKYPTFKHRFETEVKHAEGIAGSKIIKVILCDGHSSIWNYVNSNPLFENYEKLVDFYHMAEHLSKAAEALFGKSTSDAREWYKTWYDKFLLEENVAGSLIRSIDYYRKILNLSKSRVKDVLKERTYFRRNKSLMNYANFLDRGLSIGSGPVEAACKTIVKTRMCRSGMRWSREGGQHILHLRTFVKSQRWESFWNNCLQLGQAA